MARRIIRVAIDSNNTTCGHCDYLNPDRDRCNLFFKTVKKTSRGYIRAEQCLAKENK